MAYNQGGDGGGGGYMQGGGFTSPNSQSPNGGDDKKRLQTITPVTIKQIQTATKTTEDVFRINNAPIDQVSLIGIIRSVEQKSTKMTYQIEDHTGLIEATKWVDGDNEDEHSAQKRSMCREGVYVRVFAHIKTFNEKITLTALGMMVIEDYNAITHHILETIHAYLVSTKGPVGGVASAAGGSSSASAAAPMKVDRGNYGAAPVDQNNGGDGNGLNREQSAVLEVVRECMDESGITVNEVASRLKAHFPEATVKRTLDFLSAEGHVYSTIDDDHFSATH